MQSGRDLAQSGLAFIVSILAIHQQEWNLK